MSTGTFRVPPPVNEPVRAYAPGSTERATLQKQLMLQAAEVVQVPCVIDGVDTYTGRTVDVTMPCDHGHVLAKVHLAGPTEVQRALDAAEKGRAAWAAMPWDARAAVFLRAAELLAGPWRDRVNATTMLGQSKTVHQAEIDAACELIDFWRFNAHYYAQVLADQPPVSAPGTWNRTDHRPLDGFVFAVAPFNFTSIALNLCTTPAMVGNTVLWKPSLTSSLACWTLYKLLRAAGLPEGVIQLVNGEGADVGDPILADPRLAGVHFTGSTATFQHIWGTVGANIARYRTYPRLVGETGGKDFILAHASADPLALATAIARGGYEYQGQKCSAPSRVYVPESLWPVVQDLVHDMVKEMRQGDVRDFGNFVGAVIDERAFRKHERYLQAARTDAQVVVGGTADGRTGWFVAPTFTRVNAPDHVLMREEVFGPIVAAYVYPDEAWEDTIRLVDQTSPYALTGAVFARERGVIEQASAGLRHAAGNFYVNDKPTGAVVGQQPFGGGRASGTNDKAGAPQNLLRWISPRSIKETFVPPTEWRYPFLG